jgi:O-Antigen ligase
VVLALTLAAGLVALAFLTSGNSDPGVLASPGYSWSEIVMTVIGVAAVVSVVAIGARGRAWGAVTVGLFAAFTAFAALSILWSVQPDWSWYGADQLLSYLAVFTGASALARVFPERWAAIVGGVAVGMVVLSGYSLLAKVFPATLASANTYGRLQAPFGYWNAIGVSAALGLPACLWAGARRGRGVVVRALSVPAVMLLVAVVVLSYSRSAVLVAVIGAGFWVAFAPLRLRSAVILAVGGLGAVPIVLWALGDHALTSDGISLSAQDAAGHSFGLVLVVVLVAVTAAGLLAGLAMDRVSVSAPLRRRIGLVLIVLVAMIPAAAVVGLAASSRGLTGEISHVWSTLTSSKSVVFDNSSRLTQVGSSRPMYWHQGLEVGDHALLKGAGELGYGIARLQYTTEPFKTDQAHSYLIQTFADLGLIGLAITLALAVAWAMASVRPLAPRLVWRALPPERVAERQGLLVMAAVTIAFAIQSALDWTWYFPGVSVPVLICAGWLAGRGPVLAPIGRARPRASLRNRPASAALITILTGVALIAAWAMWEPLHSANALTAAENANTNAAAFADARTAASSDPLADQPLDLLATLDQGIKDTPGARAELVKATQLQPRNPEPWTWLGSFELQTGNRRAAITAMRHALALDHTADTWTKTARSVIAQAGGAAAP